MDELTERSLVLSIFAPQGNTQCDTGGGHEFAVRSYPGSFSAKSLGFRRKHTCTWNPKKNTEFFHWKLDLITLHIFQAKKNEGSGIRNLQKTYATYLVFSTSLGHKLLNMSGHPLAIHGNWFLFTYRNGWSYVGFYDKLVGEYTIPINP